MRFKNSEGDQKADAHPILKINNAHASSSISCLLLFGQTAPVAVCTAGASGSDCLRPSSQLRISSVKDSIRAGCDRLNFAGLHGPAQRSFIRLQNSLDTIPRFKRGRARVKNEERIKGEERIGKRSLGNRFVWDIPERAGQSDISRLRSSCSRIKA